MGEQMDVLDFTHNSESYVSFTASLTRKEWEGWLKKASAALQKQRPLPGFRPGAAPLPVAERLYGKTLYQAAAADAQRELLSRVCEEMALDPVSEPSAEILSADGADFACRYSFFVYPELKELNYRGLKAEKPHRAVTESDIDRELENFRRNHLRVYETEREARFGDIVEVTFRGSTDGHGFPFDSSEKSRFVLGSGQLFAGLDEALLGHHKGDELSLTLTMPKNFHRQEIAGLTLDLSVRLKGVWARELQEVNDAFVRDYVKGCGSVSEYRELLRCRLEAAYESRAGKLYESNLEAALADAVPISVPEPMIRTNYERYLRQLASAAKVQGRTPEQLLRDEGKTLESYQAELLPLAHRQVLFSLAVDYIIENEKLSVSAQELDSWRNSTAEAMGLSPEQAQSQLGDSEALIEELLTRKAMALVASAAEPTVVELETLPGEDPHFPVLVNG